MKHRLAANGTDQDLSDYYSIAGIEVQIDEDFEALAQNEEIYQIMVGCLDAEHAALMKNAGNAKLAAWWGPRCGYHSGRRREGYCGERNPQILWTDKRRSGCFRRRK